MTNNSDLRNQPVAPPETSPTDPHGDGKVAETSGPVKTSETKELVQDSPQTQARPASVAARPATRHDFQLRALPTLIGVAMIACLWPQGIPNLIVDTISDYIWLPVHGSPLASRFANHTVMLLLALGMIRLLRRRRSGENFGLVLPRGRTYVATAIILGLFFGLVMTAVDYAPEIVERVAPHDYGFQLSNVFGWLFYQGVFVGPTEEIPYRGLVVTYLTLHMPGKLRYGRFEMNGAGVVVAGIFASGFGLPALITQPLLIAVGQILYVFFGNLVLAYLLEKSGSVLAPAIGHNVALLTWKSLVFTMVTAWRS
jgi:CAAX protease family protein